MNSSKPYRKLIFIVSRFPYPLEKGDKLRAFHQLKELSQHFEVHLISLTDETISEESKRIVEQHCHALHIFKLSLISRYWNTLLSFLSQRPFQVGYFYNPLIAKKIQSLTEEIQPDHIYCQLLRTTEYLKNHHTCPKTLDYMDAFSKGIERRIEKASWYAKWLFKAEAKRLKAYERIIFDYFEHKTIISEQDKKLIIHPNQKEIVCIPNGIDTSFFEDIDHTDKYDLVFVGNMSYAPNIEAIQFIEEKVLTTNSQLTLLISGAQPHATVQKIAERNSQISLLGWVDDIRTSYIQGKIFIAPMIIGTGMQNKLLEAMALGIPCITTDLANNAIKGEHMKTICVGNTGEEINNLIELLLTNDELRRQIGENGKQYVQSHFSWKKSTNQLIELMRD